MGRKKAYSHNPLHRQAQGEKQPLVIRSARSWDAWFCFLVVNKSSIS
jgi:hypothetical protein